MNQEICDFFLREGIEYYAALSYADLTVTQPGIMSREDFSPRSVILFLLPYYVGEGENLSCYATSLDYHIIIREVTDRLCTRLQNVFPGSCAKGYGDHSPIDERAAALCAGFGILGDSGLLIHEKYGTHVFIADVISDIFPEELGASSPLPVRTCEHCGACKAACPTGILRGETFCGKYDCLSAITQRKGELTEEEKDLMCQYHTAWGCDICQSVCPHNRVKTVTPLPFFHRDRITVLSEENINCMDKQTFSQRAFAWRGKKTVLRNIAVLDEKEKTN